MNLTEGILCVLGVLGVLCLNGMTVGIGALWVWKWGPLANLPAAALKYWQFGQPCKTCIQMRVFVGIGGTAVGGIGGYCV